MGVDIALHAAAAADVVAGRPSLLAVTCDKRWDVGHAIKVVSMSLHDRPTYTFDKPECYCYIFWVFEVLMHQTSARAHTWLKWDQRLRGSWRNGSCGLEVTGINACICASLLHEGIHWDLRQRQRCFGFTANTSRGADSTCQWGRCKRTWAPANPGRASSWRAECRGGSCAANWQLGIWATETVRAMPRRTAGGGALLCSSTRWGPTSLWPCSGCLRTMRQSMRISGAFTRFGGLCFLLKILAWATWDIIFYFVDLELRASSVLNQAPSFERRKKNRNNGNDTYPYTHAPSCTLWFHVACFNLMLAPVHFILAVVSLS